LAIAGALAPASANAKLGLQRIGRFRSPTFLTSPPGDTRRQFVTERGGAIRVLRDGTKLAKPFLNITGRVRSGGEAGLLSMAFAPDYATSRRFYVYYVDKAGSVAVDEFRRSASSADRALPGSRRSVLRQAHRTDNHKGGSLQFGPDGNLYVGLGDGGPQRDPKKRGQNLHTLLGKILRIDPRHGKRYAIPKDNPFVKRAGGRKEIWAYGVRNPWRFSFTRSGSFVLADVGQDEVEEVDYVRGRSGGRQPRGGYNFGWSVFEGKRRFSPGGAPGHVKPVLQRFHSRGDCSIIGGFVVRDRSLHGLFGRYVYGDFCDSHIRSTVLAGGHARGDRAAGPRVKAMSSFGEDATGRVYAMSIAGGLWRLVNR
jgi:glucose/arabinose dehydrogenase